MALPTILSSYGFVYSTSLMTTTACGGAVAILLPLGVARGVVSSLQLVLIEEGNVKSAVEQLSKDSNPSIALGNPKMFWETMTFGSGWKGRAFRTIASPFLPSTTQMLTRLQQSVDSGQTDSKVIAAAADGLVEGFLQDKKDTITMFGVVGYAAVLGVGIGLDYSYRQMDEGRKAIAESTRKRKEAAEKKVEETKQKIRDVASIFKWKKSTRDEDTEDALNKRKDAKAGLQARNHQMEDAADAQESFKIGEIQISTEDPVRETLQPVQTAGSNNPRREEGKNETCR